MSNRCITIASGKKNYHVFHAIRVRTLQNKSRRWRIQHSTTVQGNFFRSWIGGNIHVHSREYGECLSAHQRCAKRVEKPPSRLVHIEPGPNTMRLIEAPPYMKDPYVALSHCWDVVKGDHLILTKDTLSVLPCSNSTSILCPLYTDAVIVCRKLDIKYLWIDSLCIIQDDPDDWECKAAKMADVYKGAHLTIDTLCRAGPGDSFLAARDLTLWKCASRPITFSKQQNPGECLQVRRTIRVGRHSDTAQNQLTPPKPAWMYSIR